MKLPHNKDSEIQVIGSLLFGRSEEADEVYNILVEQDFYDTRLARIYSACREMHLDMQTVDSVSVSNYLGGDPSQFDLDNIMLKVLSVSNADFHAKTVKDYSDKRKIIKMMLKINESAHDQNKSAMEIISENDAELFSIATNRLDKNVYDIKMLATRGIERIEKAMRDGRHTTGLTCGFRDIDGLTYGFQKQNLIILAARPSVGKTAMALNFALYMATHGHPVGFFSLEMSADELWNRLISMKERIDSAKIMSGSLKDSEYQNIINSRVNDMLITVDDTSSIPVSAIRSRARLMVRKQKVEMIFVDYIGLVDGDGKKHASRNLELGYISAQLKGIAKELNIPVMALCQLSRESARLQIRPRLIDLRESGNIEQDADMVIFIHRPEQIGVKTMSDGTPSEGMAEIYFEKYRNGKTGMIPMRWIGEYGQFRCVDEFHEEPKGNSKPDVNF